MKHYLSFGGGVNSVALHLLMVQEEFDFESVFVDHGTDWPETYGYFEKFQNYLKKNGHRPVTVLKPCLKTNDGKEFDNLYDYYNYKKLTPSRRYRSCSTMVKINTAHKYYKKPCFQHLGFDAGEAHRAKIGVDKGIENRFLLIEYDIDRDGCKKIISDHGLPIPIKSGCYCCPFQNRTQFSELRRHHPELFCKVEKMENDAINSGRCYDKKWVYLRQMPIREYIKEGQLNIFEIDDYPPCQCSL